MKTLRLAALAAAFLVAACGAKPVEILQPVPPSLRNAAMIQTVDVRLSPLAADRMEKFEAKAREKRAEAGLPPVDTAATLGTAAPPDEYATLPFARMFELVVMDAAREKGLTTGRAVKLDVEIDTLKTANSGMMLLAGSNDQLAGSVELTDAATGEKLGQFYVDVINSHSGLLGMALRGGGVREKLAQEFANHIAKQLTKKAK